MFIQKTANLCVSQYKIGVIIFENSKLILYESTYNTFYTMYLSKFNIYIFYTMTCVHLSRLRAYICKLLL